MKVVRFLKPHTPYAAGDVAGVDDKLAKQLVADEICEPVEAGSEQRGASERQDAEVQLPRLNVKDMQPQRDKMVKKPAVKK